MRRTSLPSNLHADRSLRYLFAEMSPSQATTFEQELREDQDLREQFDEQVAVIAALGMAVADEDSRRLAIPPDAALIRLPARMAESRWPQRIRPAAFLIGLAAAILFCVALRLDQDDSARPEFAASRLANAWIETRSQFEDPLPMPGDDEEWSDAAPPEEPPDWLVAAVSGVHSQAEPKASDKQETAGG